MNKVLSLFLSGLQPHSRSKGPIPNIYPINTDEPMDFVDNDSDDDIVLPEMAHCAGPACMLAAIPGEKYCSESCKLKHTKYVHCFSTSQQYHKSGRLRRFFKSKEMFLWNTDVS